MRTAAPCGAVPRASRQSAASRRMCAVAGRRNAAGGASPGPVPPLEPTAAAPRCVAGAGVEHSAWGRQLIRPRLAERAAWRAQRGGTGPRLGLTRWQRGLRRRRGVGDSPRGQPPSRRRRLLRQETRWARAASNHAGRVAGARYGTAGGGAAAAAGQRKEECARCAPCACATLRPTGQTPVMPRAGQTALGERAAAAGCNGAREPSETSVRCQDGHSHAEPVRDAASRGWE